IIDATRISGGSYVVIKRSDPLDYPDPSSSFLEFSSEPLASDSKNHCIRLIETLRVLDAGSEEQLIVMLLLSGWVHLPFSTIGEAVELFHQVFESLQFMHNQNIWHGDCKANSIMMDASLTMRDNIHPWTPYKTRDFSRRPRPPRSRTLNPVKYYWIDFDLSGEHDLSTGPPRTDSGYGGTWNAPESAFADQQCNPFAVDICLYRGPEKIQGFEFMQDLVADMTHKDSAKRPTMVDVVRQFSDIKASLSEWKLRSR
ncbi:hypothetical protein C8R44DRAFT_584652, partial [Mycena epipterygia]